MNIYQSFPSMVTSCVIPIKSPVSHHFSWLNLIKTTIFAGPVPPPPTAARSCRETFWEPGRRRWRLTIEYVDFVVLKINMLNWGYLITIIIRCIIIFSFDMWYIDICICGPTNYIQYHTIGRSSYSDETSWNLPINASKTDGIINYSQQTTCKQYAQFENKHPWPKFHACLYCLHLHGTWRSR